MSAVAHVPDSYLATAAIETSREMNDADAGIWKLNAVYAWIGDDHAIVHDLESC